MSQPTLRCFDSKLYDMKYHHIKDGIDCRNPSMCPGAPGKCRSSFLRLYGNCRADTVELKLILLSVCILSLPSEPLWEEN